MSAVRSARSQIAFDGYMPIGERQGLWCVRPVNISLWLFCTRKGEGYIDEAKGTARGWDSMWQRFMERILEETKVKDRFTEHDLRAKCASDAEPLEHARARLARADSQLTQRVYRRRPERVKPGKIAFE
jgi:hypothetical protein